MLCAVDAPSTVDPAPLPGAPPPPAPVARVPPEPVDPSSPLGIGAALIVFVVAFFGAQVVGGVVLAVVIIAGIAGGWLPSPSGDPRWVLDVFAHPAVLLSAAVASSATFVLTAWGACRLTRRRTREVLGLVRAPVVAVLASVIGVAAVGILVDELVTVFRTFLPSFTFGVLEAFGDAARAEGWVLRPLTFVCMTMVPGFSEELFFRGLLQRSFVARIGAPAGIALAAFVFGLVHMDPPQAIGAMLTGAFLGWVAYRSRSILPAIAAHVANNALAWLGANLEPLRQMAERHEHMPAWIVAVAVAVALGAIALVFATTRDRAGQRA